MLIDARTMTCPKPVILALEALPKLAAGEGLEVLVDNDVAVGNLTRLANEKGCALVVEDRGDHTSLTLTPSGAVEVASATEEAAAICDVPSTGESVIAVDTDVMGRGSDELGRILMKGFIYALAHRDNPPKTMLFFNHGARLTCEGSESLDDIRELEAKGTRILTCGTCLDYLGIREKLAVGGVTNLYEIAEIVAGEPGVTTL